MYLCRLKTEKNLWEIYTLCGKMHSCILDSSLHDPLLGRYSVMGYKPVRILRSLGKKIEIYSQGKWNYYQGDPLAYLERFSEECRKEVAPSFPFPFSGGLIGYLGYDLKDEIEQLPRKNIDTVGVYDQYWCEYDTFLIEDHRKNEIWLMGYDQPRFKELKETIELCLKGKPEEPAFAWMGKLQSNFSRREYIAAIEKVQAYIRQGDIYQVNISQRFSFEIKGCNRTIYNILRKISPAAFGGYFQLEGYDIFSISPERFLLITGDYIETRPIKGTRPRGGDDQEDWRLKNELEESSKDRAELLMIVDLERNDLGRISRPGTIKVEDLFRIKTYATVFHLDATVKGRIKPGMGYNNILRATFPGGSITGAPKIRSMEIIEELENVRRGVYTGSMGYIDYRGNCDLNIAIRTAVVKDNIGYYQAGGGLTIDSDPVMEYEETWDKTRALVLCREEVNKNVGSLSL